MASNETHDEHSVQRIVSDMLENAVSFQRENIEPTQKQATDYYMGRPFGDEEVGRSKVISTDIRDATLSQMPSLLRIYLSSDKVVLFKPENEYDVERAETQSAYINYIFTQDNNGFMVLYSAFMDALVRRVGFTKWWWEEGRPEGTTFYMPDEDVIARLIADESVETVDRLDNGDVEVTWTRLGKIKVAAVPPEEIVFTPHARDFDDAAVVAHVRMVPADELVAMGYDEDMIHEYTRQGEDVRQQSRLEFHRQVYGTAKLEEDIVDQSQLPVMFCEAYAKVDVDDDGIAELRKFHCIGNTYTVVNEDDEGSMGELVSHIPIAVFSPILEPHTIIGLSNYDLLEDIQRIKSQIERQVLNSLSKAIDPQMEVVHDKILNYEELLSTELSSYIRVEAINSIREIPTVFLGPQALQLIEYYNDKRGDRVGMTRAAEGLDPDVLQSTTPAAVNATLTRSRDILEMIARTLGETGMRMMFLGMLKLLVEHQDYVRRVQLDGTNFASVDPSTWHGNRGVRIDVALGSGTPEEKLVQLRGLLELQMNMMGQGSPLVTWVEIRHTLDEITDLMGHKDTSKFFTPWDAQKHQQYMQQQAEQAKNQPPDVEQQLVEVERQKIQSQQQIQLMKLKIEYQKAQQSNDTALQKILMDAILKEIAIESEFDVNISDQYMRARMQSEANRLQAQTSGQNNGN